MRKRVPYFKAPMIHEGKKVTKHFVSLAGLTDAEANEVLGELVDRVLEEPESGDGSKSNRNKRFRAR